MSTLIKSPGIPSLRSLMEDFWNTENVLERGLFRKEILPAVNIKENEADYQIEVAAPGYKKNDFKIEVSDGVLSISAETKDEKSEESDNYTRKEFSSSSFCRSFSLPDNVNDEMVNAKYEDGLLQLKLSKSNKAEAKKKMISVE